MSRVLAPGIQYLVRIIDFATQIENAFHSNSQRLTTELYELFGSQAFSSDGTLLLSPTPTQKAMVVYLADQYLMRQLFTLGGHADRI